MSPKNNLIITATFCLALLIITESYAQETSPRTINTTVLLNTGDHCPTAEEKERAFNTTEQQVRALLSEYVSAGELYTCKGTPGWRQLVFINMTDPRYDCPPGLALTYYSKRTCGRIDNTFCYSSFFSTNGFEYSQVCGRINAYQVGLTTSFSSSLFGGQSTLDDHYVSGISLTHGPVGNRSHVWTFAVGAAERYAVGEWKCPCNGHRYGTPPFVGRDFFCEAGINSDWNIRFQGVPFLDDLLWDGQNCTSTSTCCQFNNPPWFTRYLNNATTDDIEMRLCLTNGPHQSDVAIELVELYIK